MIKQKISDLALFGGSAQFSQPLHVGRPNIGDRSALFRRFNDILDRRWLTNNGNYVQEFEHKVAELLGVRHCIAMCNGTVALEITIRALGMHGEVILPAMTFVATAHALMWQEITPVFCDIDPATHNLDSNCVERLITPRTTGILGVHLWGRPAATEALGEISRRHGLRLLFDAAHGFGCSSNGAMIGNFGDAEVFSFHATKYFNTFEGGAVVTNDDELAARIRLMKNFGFAGYDRVVYLGINGKMNEMSAAMGVTGFESLNDFVGTNYAHYQLYRRELDGLPGVQMVSYEEREKNNYQYIVLEIDQTQTGISRDQLIELLHAENVIARRYFYPGCHRMEPYRSQFPNAGRSLPQTEALAERIMCLPNGTSVGSDEVLVICKLLRFFLNNSLAIKKKLTELI